MNNYLIQKIILIVINKARISAIRASAARHEQKPNKNDLNMQTTKDPKINLKMEVELKTKCEPPKVSVAEVADEEKETDVPMEKVNFC